MIFPIGHEGETEVRRLPWVTFGIILINLLVFFFSSRADKQVFEDIKSQSVRIISYYMEHPWLRFTPPGGTDMGPGEDENVLELWAGVNRDTEIPDEDTVLEQQDHLDSMIRELIEIRDGHPFWKFGLIASKRTLSGLLLHSFLHAGWLHLISNLFFLYLMGPFLEDVWGRPLYAVFYIFSGIVSGMMYTLHYPAFSGPLIGASGAISGVIAAFLIRYWNRRIKFFFWVFFLFGTFTAPAWMMLIFEVTRELFYAYMSDSMTGTGGGVAYWAHFWGLAFGIIAAVFVKKLDIEKRFVDPVIEKDLKYIDKDFGIFQHAMELNRNGQPEAAFDELKGISSGSWKLPEIGEEMWNIGDHIGREHEAVPVLIRSIESRIRKDQTDRALVSFIRLKERFPETSLKDVSMKLKLLRRLIAEEDGKGSEDLLMEIMNEVDTGSPAGILLEACNVLWEFDSAFHTRFATALLRKALLHPDIPEERKERIRKALSSDRPV